MLFNADNNDSDFVTRWSQATAEEAEEPCTALVKVPKMEFAITVMAHGEPLYTIDSSSLPGAIQRAKAKIRSSEVLTEAMIIECSTSRTRGVVRGNTWKRAS